MAAYLIERLKENGKKLESLNMSFNAIGNSGALRLISAIRGCPLQNLRSFQLEVGTMALVTNFHRQLTINRHSFSLER